MSHSCAEFPLTTCTAQEGCGTSLTLVYYPVFIRISRDIVGVVGGFCVCRIVDVAEIVGVPFQTNGNGRGPKFVMHALHVLRYHLIAWA